jgi:hypothetical protein
MAVVSGFKAGEDVLTESGRTWNQWFTELKSEKFKGLSCDEVEDRLVYDYNLERNWARKITNRFAAHHHDLEEGDQRPCFDLEIRKTVPYPMDRALSSAAQWFETEDRVNGMEVINGNQLHCEWSTDRSKVALLFQSKGKDKTQMVLQHDRMHSQTDADIMRNFWHESLKGMVEAL